MTSRELEKVAKALRSALQIVEKKLEPPAITPEVQAEVDRKIAARICLAWDHVIEEGVRVIRGQCSSDYHTTMARVRRGDDDENELIRTGKLLAEGKRAGRKAARDVALKVTPEEARRVAEDMARYSENKKKKGG